MKHINLYLWAKRPSTTTLLLLSSVLMTLTVGCTAAQQEAGLIPPPNFQPLAQVDLATQLFDGEILGQFALEEPAVTSIFYTIPNIDTTEFDLRLSGPNEDSYVILHSENYRTDEKGGGTWEQSLAPGTYQVVLTASQTSGTLSVYWK